MAKAMQIAGNKCRICSLPIVLSTEGKGCPQCQTVRHLSCDTGDVCSICGQPFVRDEPSPFNPAEDAVLPPSLRAEKNAAPALILMLGVAMGALILFAFYSFPCGPGR